MKRRILILAILGLAGLRLNAGEATRVESKNKSSFTMDASRRSRFWPIGWKPTAKVADKGTDHGGAAIPTNAFAVSSITLGQGRHYAIINGRIMEEGQQFGLQLG